MADGVPNPYKSMPLALCGCVALHRLRICSRGRCDLLLDSIQPVAHPFHIPDEEIVPSGPSQGEPEQHQYGDPGPALIANLLAYCRTDQLHTAAMLVLPRLIP
jgi:hypothetical protein